MHGAVKLLLFVAIISPVLAQLTEDAVNVLIDRKIQELKDNFDTEFSQNIDGLIDEYLDGLNVGEEFKSLTGISIGAVIAIVLVVIIIPNVIITVLIVLCCFCCCGRNRQGKGSQSVAFVEQRPNNVPPLSRAPVKDYNPAPTTHMPHIQTQHNPTPNAQSPPPTPVKPSILALHSSAPKDAAREPSSGMWPWGGSNVDNQRQGHNNASYKPEW